MRQLHLRMQTQAQVPLRVKAQVGVDEQRQGVAQADGGDIVRFPLLPLQVGAGLKVQKTAGVAFVENLRLVILAVVEVVFQLKDIVNIGGRPVAGGHLAKGLGLAPKIPVVVMGYFLYGGAVNER